MTSSVGETTWVIRVDVIRAAIAVLTSRPVHPFFIAYLEIRSRAFETGDFSDIRPRWADLGKFLEVPGGPPGKPFYRPLLDGQVHDRSRYWMNPNLAGSWAPSSLRRGQVPLEVVRINGRGYALDDGHAQRAFEHLLHSQQLSAFALVAFLYRNFGFIKADGSPDEIDILNAFIDDFHFDSSRGSNDDFDMLFKTEALAPPQQWFEVYDQLSGE